MDIVNRYRGISGLLREMSPRAAYAWEWLKYHGEKMSNDPGLAMLPGPMAMEIEAEQVVSAVARAGRAARRPTGAWEKGEILWNKSIEETRRIGAKGGKAAWANKTAEQWADWEDRVAYESTYHGPEPGPRETTHAAAAKLDDQFPWLRDAFKKTEADVRRQALSSAAGKAKLTARGPRIAVRQPREDDPVPLSQCDAAILRRGRHRGQDRRGPRPPGRSGRPAR